MFLFKLGFLTCAFYIGLTLLFEGAILAMEHLIGPTGVFWSGRHSFWTLGARLGAIFGVLWMISFSAAWCIVYSGLKFHIGAISN
jgi:hypothetical protein